MLFGKQNGAHIILFLFFVCRRRPGPTGRDGHIDDFDGYLKPERNNWLGYTKPIHKFQRS